MSTNKFAFVTFGCKVNQYESQKLREEFLKMGFEETESHRDAEVCMINTCTITARGDQKARSVLGKIHKENPAATIIVTGCYATARKDRDELLSIPGVGMVVGNHEKMEIPRMYAEQVGKTFPRQEVEIAPATNARTRMYLKIQDGCNLMCTFCKIPYIRPHLKSKPPSEVVAEAEMYARQGFREIVLTGIHLGLYDVDRPEEYFIPHLLEKLAAVEGLERIRLSSIEANEITPELVQVTRDIDKICPHFHIPLQAGNDRVLEAMNRKYTMAEFYDKIDMLNSELDSPGLTTDIIYGFATETDEEFEDTLESVRRSGFHRVHAFPFSPRRRTRAYKFTPRVKPIDMKSRKKRLLEVAEEVSLEYRREFLGRQVRILLESSYDEKTGLINGYSDRYLKCYLPEGEQWANRVVEGEISEIYRDGVLCRRVV